MRSSSNQILVLALALVLPWLASCGGGGSSSGGGTTGPTITLSGTTTFDRVHTTASGLDYGTTIASAIRGAIVQVRNSSGSKVLYQSSTDSSGN